VVKTEVQAGRARFGSYRAFADDRTVGIRA
jgi:hypothetical protein